MKGLGEHLSSSSSYPRQMFDVRRFVPGTDENAVIRVLTSCSNEQRQLIKLQFKTMFGKVCTIGSTAYRLQEGARQYCTTVREGHLRLVPHLLGGCNKSVQYGMGCERVWLEVLEVDLMHAPLGRDLGGPNPGHLVGVHFQELRS